MKGIILAGGIRNKTVSADQGDIQTASSNLSINR